MTEDDYESMSFIELLASMKKNVEAITGEKLRDFPDINRSGE